MKGNRPSWKPDGLLIYAAIYLTFIYLPVLFLPLFSFNSSTYITFPLKDFTLKWYEKIKLSKEFGPDEKLEMIKNRCKFFKIVKYINEKFYIKSLKEIVFYPNSIGRIKLFLMLIIPKKIFNRIISLR